MECRPALMVDLGLVAYPEALAQQRRLVELRCRNAVPDLLLLCQHPPVITIGRAGSREHLHAERCPDDVPVLEVERGGDVTYHGPGQLVGYPILSLAGPERDLHRYLRCLEEVVLRTLAAFDLHGERFPGLTGVWSGNNKLCAIGVAVRHWVTLHGFALNVNTDLRAFEWIVPCGLRDRGVTSMQRLLGAPVDYTAVQREAARHFGSVFSRSLRPACAREILDTPMPAGGGEAVDGNHGDRDPSDRNRQRQPERLRGRCDQGGQGAGREV